MSGSSSDATCDDANALDVLGLGCVTLDTIGTVDEFPPADAKTRIFDLEEHGGGPAATAMVACARLGLRAGLVAKIGELGDTIRALKAGTKGELINEIDRLDEVIEKLYDTIHNLRKKIEN